MLSRGLIRLMMVRAELTTAFTGGGFLLVLTVVSAFWELTWRQWVTCVKQVAFPRLFLVAACR